MLLKMMLLNKQKKKEWRKQRPIQRNDNRFYHQQTFNTKTSKEPSCGRRTFFHKEDLIYTKGTVNIWFSVQNNAGAFQEGLARHKVLQNPFLSERRVNTALTLDFANLMSWRTTERIEIEWVISKTVLARERDLINSFVVVIWSLLKKPRKEKKETWIWTIGKHKNKMGFIYLRHDHTFVNDF